MGGYNFTRKDHGRVSRATKRVENTPVGGRAPFRRSRPAVAGESGIAIAQLKGF